MIWPESVAQRNGYGAGIGDCREASCQPHLNICQLSQNWLEVFFKVAPKLARRCFKVVPSFNIVRLVVGLTSTLNKAGLQETTVLRQPPILHNRPLCLKIISWIRLQETFSLNQYGILDNQVKSWYLPSCETKKRARCRKQRDRHQKSWLKSCRYVFRKVVKNNKVMMFEFEIF